MKIIFDARVLTHKKYTGVENYAKNILKSLNSLTIVYAAPSITNKYLAHLWSHLLLPFKKGDILFCPANIAPFFIPQRKKLILTLHDLAFVDQSDSFSKLFRWYYNFLVPINIKRAHKIITVSYFSKKQIIRKFPKSKNKIEVIYNGVEPIFFQNDSVQKIKQILYVGSLNPRKNFKVVIKAFEKLNLKNYKLQIVGNFSDNFSKDPIAHKILNEAKSNQNIIFHENIDNELLVKLYKESALFVLPSLYEGFGLPILEAFASSTPVLVSDIEVFREVAGDAAVYFDPYDYEELQLKIEQVLNDKSLQENMIKNGRIRVSNFSWESSVLKHQEIFQKVISET